MKTYKDIDIDFTYNGFFRCFIPDIGYLRADTLQGLKKLINKEIKK